MKQFAPSLMLSSSDTYLSSFNIHSDEEMIVEPIKMLVTPTGLLRTCMSFWDDRVIDSDYDSNGDEEAVIGLSMLLSGGLESLAEVSSDTLLEEEFEDEEDEEIARLCGAVAEEPTFSEISFTFSSFSDDQREQYDIDTLVDPPQIIRGHEQFLVHKGLLSPITKLEDYVEEHIIVPNPPALKRLPLFGLEEDEYISLPSPTFANVEKPLSEMRAVRYEDKRTAELAAALSILRLAHNGSAGMNPAETQVDPMSTPRSNRSENRSGIDCTRQEQEKEWKHITRWLRRASLHDFDLDATVLKTTESLHKDTFSFFKKHHGLVTIAEDACKQLPPRRRTIHIAMAA